MVRAVGFYLFTVDGVLRLLGPFLRAIRNKRKISCVPFAVPPSTTSFLYKMPISTVCLKITN
jgi:hypothetical protein